jgi:hypothetical protein
MNGASEMSAQIIDLRTHRIGLGKFVPTPIPAMRDTRAEVADKVRGYCELLSLSPEQIGTCAAVAMVRLKNGAHVMNAVAAGKDRADRMFRARYVPRGGSDDAA